MNHLLMIRLPGEKKGIGCFYGEVTLFNDKPAVIITNKDQIIIEERK
jgi:hypothetical protein